MEIKTEIKDGATVSVSLDLAPEGVSRIHIVADTPEGRDRAMAQVQKVLPEIRKLEDALIAEDLERDPIVTRTWFIRLSRFTFFQGMKDGAVVQTEDYAKYAPSFDDYNLAQQVVDKLKTLKIPARVELLTARRRTSEIATSLSQVGFQE